MKDLRIEGNAHVSNRQIENKILTTQTGWWPFATKHYFDPVTWEADLRRIVRIYVARSYYQARIAGQQVTPKPPNGVALTVHVDEGEPTRIGAVQIDGLEGLPPADREAALKRLPLTVGKPFEESDWEAAKAGLVSRLRARGYFKAAADGQARVDVGTRQAAVTIIVSPGLKYRFGDIQISQAPGSVIPAAFIWDQVRLAIPNGAVFSDDALEEAQRRVFGMGMFALAKIGTGTPDDATARIPVAVTTREAPFRTLRLGGGVTVDQIHNEARLIGEWTNRNFHGGMRKLTVHAEAGWAFIPSIYAVATNDVTVAPRSGPVADLSLAFEQPRLFSSPSLRSQSAIELSRTIEQTYDNIGGRFSTGVVWQPRARLSIFPSYNLEGDFLNGAPVNSAALAPLTLGCHTTSGECLVWLSYLEEVVTWDRRNHPLEPRNGTYASLSVQEGGGPLGGDFNYIRVLPDLRGYVSFLEGNALTFAARLRVGELWTFSNNPEDSAVTTRFYAGGANSMRGFSERRLSPLLEAPVPNTKPALTETVPIGGNGMIDGSLETRYSLTDSFRLAGFLDFGQVTTGLVGLGDVSGLQWALGIGIRYLTSIGPIRVDIARRLPFGSLPPLYTTNPTTGAIMLQSYQVDESCFGLFAPHPNTIVTDGSCVFQFSIGEAF